MSATTFRQELLTHRLEEREDADSILLLNGGMMTFASWEPVATHLRPEYRLLLCDLRGQLLSPGASHDELEGHAEDLVRLLDEIEIDKVHLLGTSFGAEVGLQLAATRPDRVETLIAVTAVDRPTPSMLRGSVELRKIVREVLQGGDRGPIQDLLLRDIYSPGYVEAHREELVARRTQLDQLPETWFEGLLGIIACTEGFDLRSVLGGIRCPTFIILAANDRVMPPEASQVLADQIPWAEVAIHPKSGHALIAEDPEWLATVCLDFLGRERARREVQRT